MGKDVFPWVGVLQRICLPMYIILISTLLPQTGICFSSIYWKHFLFKVCSSSHNDHLMLPPLQCVHDCYRCYGNLMNSKFPFLHNSINRAMLLRLSLKIYISILGITAIQYYLSLRFKNFVVSVGIGLALVIGAITALNLHWEHVYQYPYAFPIITSDLVKKAGRPLLENHEWYSIGYMVFFLLLGFLDMKMRKEKRLILLSKTQY